MENFERNALGQPLGLPVPGWQGAPLPQKITLNGRYCRVEALDAARHGEALYAALAGDAAGWTYLGGRPDSLTDFMAKMRADESSTDPLFFAIVDDSGQAQGIVSYLRIDAPNGVIEMGWIHFSPRLQRSRVASEALFLLMQHAFSLGYRRCEWKCDALNAPSREAALRLGFSYEGTFRQARVRPDGRNRDTAWFSLLDGEWPAVLQAFNDYLLPENFDAQGRQRRALAARHMS